VGKKKHHLFDSLVESVMLGAAAQAARIMEKMMLMTIIFTIIRII